MPNLQKSNFYPFYDPYNDSGGLGYGTKFAISLGFGIAYALLQYYSLTNKVVFFSENCWILALIISTATFALYIATDIFRSNLIVIREIEGKAAVRLRVVDEWMSDKWFLLAGFAFGTTNTTVGHLLGVPTAFFESSSALTMVYLGFFLAGFFSGMGLLAITAVIVLYLRFAPSLQHTLDPHNPDGNGGIKKLGDSLWFFGGLIGAVGILVSIHMFGVTWTFMHKPSVQIVFLLWVSLPYVLAVSIVLIPGLAVRRQVSYFKSYKSDQLKQEKVKLYSNYKQFKSKDDEDIISEKKELGEKLEKIQDELEKLKNMRNSHIDGRNSD
ncbi:MAG: hypothetical protein DHS20C12_01290 [Pseudohongiella sp.]|nr:MAG: hypothetical protein DHS20C12_01290 [Pseudohongiella sp.]